MKCLDCKTDRLPKKIDLQVDNFQVGRFNLADAEIFECPDCKSRLYTYETAKRIDDQVERMVSDFLEMFPVKDYITLNEAAEILQVSKQAFSKNGRIKRGFIYSRDIGGRRLFLKPSVIEFKKSGDGRFNLADALSETGSKLSLGLSGFYCWNRLSKSDCSFKPSLPGLVKICNLYSSQSSVIEKDPWAEKSSLSEEVAAYEMNQ
jgi:hypothetical protein